MDIFLCDSGLDRGIKQLASKVKKGATKRQRTRDTSDDDYNPSVDLDAQSSMGDYSMNTDDPEDAPDRYDDPIDMTGWAFEEKQWTAEQYHRIRTPSQYALARETNVMYFYTQV